jgi:hypothetical protein
MVNWFTMVLFGVGIYMPSRLLGIIVEILTSQLILPEFKILQIRQFDDFGRNWPYTKSRQNSEKGEMVNWFFTKVYFTGRS